MTLGVSDLQSDSDLDLIRNSCDVFLVTSVSFWIFHFISYILYKIILTNKQILSCDIFKLCSTFYRQLYKSLEDQSNVVVDPLGHLRPLPDPLVPCEPTPCQHRSSDCGDALIWKEYSYWYFRQLCQYKGDTRLKLISRTSIFKVNLFSK